MNISIIAAMDTNRVIGNENQLPWHLPADLRHFKEMTIGKPVVMGRKTYESIGKALPERHNIVISGQTDLQLEDCDVVTSLEAALATAGSAEEIMIIGGASIYEQALKYADTMYITFVDTEANGDTFFPKWDKESWQEISREKHPADEKNRFSYSFVTLKKV